MTDTLAPDRISAPADLRTTSRWFAAVIGPDVSRPPRTRGAKAVA